MKVIIDVPDNETLIGWYTHKDGINQYHNAKTLGKPNYILFDDVMVDPKKTGRWIDMPIGFKCSNCNELEDRTTIYCPNCGTMMI